MRYCAILGIFCFLLIQACSIHRLVPNAAENLAEGLDRQLLTKLRANNNNHHIARNSVLIMSTSAVNLNTLTQTCPLSKQMTEELTTKLMALGYRCQELRSGSFIRFDRKRGELILTRDVPLLKQPFGSGHVILAGTYVITKTDVRFTYSFIHVISNEILAKISATVPITNDIIPLLQETAADDDGRQRPNTYTKLR